MTLNEYNRFCRSLSHTTTVVQWGGAHVWKVAGKVFAIGRVTQDDHELHVTFKCSPMSYDMLKEMPGCRPAPYLASRGMKWIQRTTDDELSDTGLKDYLRASYAQVVQGLPRRTQQELGLASTAKDVKTNAKPPPHSTGTSPRPASKTRQAASIKPKTKMNPATAPAAKRTTSRKGAKA